jgi:hypothetical protein
LTEAVSPYYTNKKNFGFQYLNENPNSLITKHLGLYRIKQGKKLVYFTVTQSLFDSERYKISQIFDLKGSHVGRKRQAASGPLLDRDLTRKITVNPELRVGLLDQIKRDANVGSLFLIFLVVLLLISYNC